VTAHGWPVNLSVWVVLRPLVYVWSADVTNGRRPMAFEADQSKTWRALESGTDSRFLNRSSQSGPISAAH
jgi:hypothetical protein